MGGCHGRRAVLWMSGPPAPRLPLLLLERGRGRLRRAAHGPLHPLPLVARHRPLPRSSSPPAGIGGYEPIHGDRTRRSPCGAHRRAFSWSADQEDTLRSWVQIDAAPSGYGRETGLEEREKIDETSWEVGLGRVEVNGCLNVVGVDSYHQW
jgi:hypothetical protein